MGFKDREGFQKVGQNHRLGFSGPSAGGIKN